jgi:hypothetical protein
MKLINAVILLILANNVSASCPGPDGEVGDGEEWVEGHFLLRCTSTTRRYKISPVGCATVDGTFISWNSEIRENSVNYKCLRDGRKKMLRVRLSSGLKAFFFSAPKDQTGPVNSPTDILARICYIPGVGKVSLGDDVQRDQLVLRCGPNGIYKVTHCILPTGDRIPIRGSRIIGNHRWTCNSVRGGASALISSIPIERRDTYKPSCNLGAVKEKKGFRVRCLMNEENRAVWEVTHCKLRKGNQLIPVGESIKKGKIVFTCSKLRNNRVRISISVNGKRKNRRPLDSLKSSRKRSGGKRGENCERACRIKRATGIETICPGDDMFLSRNSAGDSRARCTTDSHLERYCRVKAKETEDFYEIAYKTYTEVEGYFLACAQFEGNKEVTPENTAPANSRWRRRLERHNFRFTPSNLLRRR